MPNHRKRDVRPYEALIAFANVKKITKDNWEKVLDGVLVRTFGWDGESQLEIRDLVRPKWRSKRRDDSDSQRESQEQLPIKNFWWKVRVRLINPRFSRGRIIGGPKPLQRVQEELRKDLARLSDPARDLSPLLLSPRAEQHDSYTKGWKSQIVNEPLKEMSWLHNKLESVLGQTGMTLRLNSFSSNPSDRRLLVTSRMVLCTDIKDLRTAVYYCLASMWAEGFLPHIGRCRYAPCRQFFLALTWAKKQFCSPACSKNAKALKRVKKQRARRTEWRKVRQRLEKLNREMDAIIQGEGSQPSHCEEVLKKSVEVLQEARSVFSDAFPRRTGPAYEEGKAFLTRVAARIRTLPWDIAREVLRKALEKTRKLYQTTARQALADAADALSNARCAFNESFPEKRGQDYEKGRTFLAEADEQVKQLRKKVKGY